MNCRSVETESGPLDLSASLVHLETSRQELRWRDTPSQANLHKRWAAIRKETIDALMVGDEALSKRATRIEGCCSHPLLTLKESGKLGVVLFCCKDRMCPRCQTGRAIENSKRINLAVTNMNAPRQIELTIKHKQATLRGEIDRLWKAFKALRKTKFWQSVVHGGIGVLEITINPKTRLWHPHLHLVVDGDFIPQKKLSEEWKKCTGDSEVVWIQAVHDRAKTALYVAKYLAKSANPCDMTHAEIREFASALHGRRMVFTFGKCVKKNLDPAPEPQTHAKDTPLITVERIVQATKIDFKGAKRTLELLAKSNRVIAKMLGESYETAAAETYELTKEDTDFIVDVCTRLTEARSKPHDDEPPDEPGPYRGGGSHQLGLLSASVTTYT